MPDLCDRLRRARLAAGLSLRDAAKLADCTLSYLSHMEHDRKGNPRLSMLKGFADGTGVNLAWLVTGEGPMYQRPRRARDVLPLDPYLDEALDNLVVWWQSADASERARMRVHLGPDMLELLREPSGPRPPVDVFREDLRRPPLADRGIGVTVCLTCETPAQVVRAADGTDGLFCPKCGGSG